MWDGSLYVLERAEPRCSHFSANLCQRLGGLPFLLWWLVSQQEHEDKHSPFWSPCCLTTMAGGSLSQTGRGVSVTQTQSLAWWQGGDSRLNGFSNQASWQFSHVTNCLTFCTVTHLAYLSYLPVTSQMLPWRASFSLNTHAQRFSKLPVGKPLSTFPFKVYKTHIFTCFF